LTTGESAPDGTLPLVLLILGALGLGAVAVNPRRAKR
jgi:MYXO-CTERM domain-containing protein